MKIIKVVTVVTICLAVIGCGSGDPVTPATSSDDKSDLSEAVHGEVAAPPPAAGNQMTTRRTQMWAASCALCHVDGNAFAPRSGNAEEWLPRVAKGRDVLLENTIAGLNAMPPLGYCMACERDDFVAMIDFMTANLMDGEAQ